MDMHNEAVSAAGSALQAALHHAFERGQFELHYQPQIRIATGEVVGIEALLRWRHPALGLLLPGQFLPTARKSGLIIPLAGWVLQSACRQNRAWQEAGLPFLQVSVNVSALEFCHDGLVDLVNKVLADAGLEPRYLDLELSESLVLGAADSVRERLHALHELGIAVSIDDCGKRFSDVGRFVTGPLHQLKIDRSCVRQLPADTRAASVARSIVSIGSSTGVRVLAMGVETPGQLNFLRTIWCDYAQGNLYSVPLPARAFEAWARKPDATRRAAVFNRQVEAMMAD